MKKMKYVCLGLALSLLTGCASSGGAASKEAQKQQEAKVVSTSVAICDIMDRLNLDLVGVPTTNNTLPERYSSVTEIGSPMSPDLEILKMLHPTDVVSPNSLQGDLEPKYNALGLESTFLDLKSVEGLYEGIALLGEKYDRRSEAKALIDEYHTFMEAYKAENGSEEGPRVLILMGLPGSYVVATEKSYVGNLVKLAGGQNVYADETEDFINVNTEDLVQTAPDLILRTSHALPEQVAEMFAKEFAENAIWSKFTAVQEGKVYDLDYHLFGMSATFDYVEALEALQPILYEKEA